MFRILRFVQDGVLLAGNFDGDGGVVLTSAAPSGMASYKPWSCFLFREAARVFRANWSRGLFLASGSSNLADLKLIMRGTPPSSSLACCSFCPFASWTSVSLSRSSSYHLTWLMSSSSPMMSSSE